MLYYEAAIRHSKRERIARIVDVNAAFAGGKHAEKLIKNLKP